MENMMVIGRVLHSWTRWVFVVIAIVALVMFILGLLQNRAWDKRANTLLNIYSSVLSLQWLFGLILLISWGSIIGFNQRHFWEHLTIQTLAVIVANAHHGWRRRSLPDSARWRNGLLVIVISMILIVAGILLLPIDIQWRFYTP
jgi:hypothetical protein